MLLLYWRVIRSIANIVRQCQSVTNTKKSCYTFNDISFSDNRLRRRFSLTRIRSEGRCRSEHGRWRRCSCCFECTGCTFWKQKNWKQENWNYFYKLCLSWVPWTRRNSPICEDSENNYKFHLLRLPQTAAELCDAPRLPWLKLEE